MNDDASLASSYYEIIENLSIIWEETSQDLHSIVTNVTNPKHRRWLSNGLIPHPPSSPRRSPRSLDGKGLVAIPLPPSSPLLSPRSLEGTPRVRNIRKSPLLRKNTLSLGQEPILELEESEEHNNTSENLRRDSILVTSLRTGELVTLPLQDDEFTFESCTTGSDMQSVISIEYVSDDEEQDKQTSTRWNGIEETTEDEIIFEIVDELKEELLMIKHARDETMKALYFHDSSPVKTQSTTATKSEEFMSRLSTITNAPSFGNITEITDSSSLLDILPSVREAAWKNESTTSENARETNNSLPARISSSLDPNLPETETKDETAANERANPALISSLPDPVSTLNASPNQDVTTQSSQAIIGGSVEQNIQSESPQSSTIVDLGTSASKIAMKHPSETKASLSMESTSTMEKSSQSQSSNTDSPDDNGCAPLDKPSTFCSIGPHTESAPPNSETIDKNYIISPSEEASATLHPAATSADPTIDASTTNAHEGGEVFIPEEKSIRVNQITPSPNFASVKKWLISNLKQSFFNEEKRQAFRRNIDGLAGQRRRVHYNSSRLLLKRRLRNCLKPQDRKVAAQNPYYEQPDQFPTEESNYGENDSMEILIANPQDDFQQDHDCNSLPGGNRRLRRSARRRSEGDLRNIVREGKRAELRSKILGIEDRLERIRLNLSSSFSSMASIENGEGEEDADVAVEDNERLTQGWSSSRSFSEGMTSPDQSTGERNGLKERLERIRGKKKMNLEKLQHALDSAMEAISAEMG